MVTSVAAVLSAPYFSAKMVELRLAVEVLKLWCRLKVVLGDENISCFTCFALMHTHQAENEYASLIRGDEGTESTDNTAPLLRPVECNNQEVRAQSSKVMTPTLEVPVR